MGMGQATEPVYGDLELLGRASLLYKHATIQGSG